MPGPEVVALLQTFAVAFTRPTFAHAVILLYGAILAPGRRTVAATLRAVGLRDERHFTSYHRVLNRAVWSPLRLSRLLLELIASTLLPSQAAVMLVVDTTRCVRSRGMSPRVRAYTGSAWPCWCRFHGVAGRGRSRS